MLYRIFCYLSLVFLVSSETDVSTEGQVQKSFSTLLKNIVSLNEKRLNNVKKLAKLDDATLTRNRFIEYGNTNVFGEDFIGDIMDEEGVLSGYNFEQDYPRNRREINNSAPKNILNLIAPVLKSDDSNVKRNRVENEKTRRTGSPEKYVKDYKNWHHACDKAAAKICEQSCRTTYRNGCESFSCSKRAVRTFKKECKKNCLLGFNAEGWDESSSLE